MKGAFAPGGKRSGTSNETSASLVRSISPVLLQQAVAAALDDGAAILLGNTRDGRTVCVTLMVGEQRHKAYASTAGELEAVLNDATESFAPQHIARPPAKDRAARNKPGSNEELPF